MRILFFFFTVFFFQFQITAQSIETSYKAGESMSDRYKFSNIIATENDGNGGVVIVRAYYGGMIIRLQGYYIEHYNESLELINKYNYKADDVEIMGVVAGENGISIIEVGYNKESGHYIYWANTTKLDNFQFRKKELFRFKREREKRINFLTKYEVPFNDKFYSQLLFDSKKSVFMISIDSKIKSRDLHKVYFFDANLNNLLAYELKEETLDRHLVFENLEYNKTNNSFYLLSKAYEQGKRTKAISLKYRYQLFRFTKESPPIMQYFEKNDLFASSLKLIADKEILKCVGFYSNFSDRKYRGLVFVALDANTLSIKDQLFNPFSAQFMTDKYGAETDKELKNLGFRDLHIQEDGSIIFNAEEEYVSSKYKNNPDDSRTQIFIYHYNDIVCAKLNANGKMEWARNINKAERTMGDEAYVSYTSVVKDGNTCFFVNSGSVPQRISGERILFKKGYSKSPEVYMIVVKNNGDLSYKQVTNKKDIRLPVMVSKGVVAPNNESVFFLARRGNRKQPIRVPIEF
ncbi:hypothetical protein [Ascidiimonas sp. W6]|uniref:hypothetical protein n=1 Tax=Ascidiimonas meishanensis TaxID=3128903 RepID=UPI0030EF5B37